MAVADKSKTQAQAQTQAEVAKDIMVDAIRNQPTDAEIAEAKAAAKPTKKEYVNVLTTSGGTMWDPDEGQWIEGRSTRAVKSNWIERQKAAGKIVDEKE